MSRSEHTSRICFARRRKAGACRDDDYDARLYDDPQVWPVPTHHNAVMQNRRALNIQHLILKERRFPLREARIQSARPIAANPANVKSNSMNIQFCQYLMGEAVALCREMTKHDPHDVDAAGFVSLLSWKRNCHFPRDETSW